MRLFNWFIVRRLIREPLRSVMTTLGVALGVAVIVAIQLTNASSLAGFETALNTVSGKASVEIVNPGGAVDETLLPSLVWLRAFGDVAPVIDGSVEYLDHGHAAGRLRVLGIDILRDTPFREYRLIEWAGRGDRPRPQELLDLLRDPSSAVITAKFGEKHGLAIGSTFDVRAGDRVLPLTVRGLLKDDGPARLVDGQFVLMDIAAAQLVLARGATIDRLEVRIDDGTSIDDAEQAIAARLPPGLGVERPSQRSRQVEHMLAAFHANLTALSSIALIVGLFLVYNTVSVAVIVRRTEIGTLRALGVTRGQVRNLFLLEAALVALAGCACGVAIGRFLADLTVRLTATTVSTLYVATAAAPPALTWRHVVIAFTSGVPLSLLAALVPAQEASRVAPVTAIRDGDGIAARGRTPWVSGIVATLLLGVGVFLATLGPVHGLPLFGYASAAAIIFGASCLVPFVLSAAVRTAIGALRGRVRVESWLAFKNLLAAIPRLSISVAALAVSLSMMVAIAIMIGSFRDTVRYWIDQSLRADLYVSPGDGRGVSERETLSQDTVDAIRSASPGGLLDEVRFAELPFADTRVRVVSRDFTVVLARGGLLFKAPADGQAALRGAIGADAVAASEAFVLKQGVKIGDLVPITAAAGPVAFRIAAIYYDYSSDRGVLLMDRATFARHFGDRPPNGISVYLPSGVEPDVARDRILGAAGATRQIFINTNRSLHDEILRIFDSTFAITYALELVAIIVAMLGVSGTLLTLILEREQEFTMLRLVGAERRQVRRIVVAEAVVLGAVSQTIGIGVGVALSVLLIKVINVQSFGWTIQFHLPLPFLVQSSVAVVAATVLAALYPARRAAQLHSRTAE